MTPVQVPRPDATPVPTSASSSSSDDHDSHLFSTDNDSTSVDSVGDDGVHDLDLIGTKVRRKFDLGWFDGEVISVVANGIYKVRYEDGDMEDLERDELYEHELTYDQHYMVN